MSWQGRHGALLVEEENILAETKHIAIGEGNAAVVCPTP